MTDQTINRMAPHSIEAEEGVLGSILIDPTALWDVADALAVEDFFIIRNGWVYETLVTLANVGKPIDYITVTEDLRRRQTRTGKDRLEEVGGSAYITYLINNTPSSLYARAYGQLVHRAALRRRLLNAASEIAQLAHDGERDISAVQNEAMRLVSDTVDSSSDGAQRAGLVAADDMDRVEARRLGGQSQGLSSGLTDLDRMLGGFSDSKLYILAGRPAMGKTAEALTIMLNMARDKTPVAIFSMEMSKSDLVHRLIAMIAGISVQRIEQGDLSDLEWAGYVNAVAELDELPIYIDDSPDINPLEMRAKARRLVMTHGIRAVFVDYLQLMNGGGRHENRTNEITYISRQLKVMARELDVPVIALSQLSRAVENRQDKRPILSDLRESGSIEQDADVVIFLFRDEYYNENTERPNQIDNIIAKHRNGPTGMVPLHFRKELTMVANLKRLDYGSLKHYDGTAESTEVDFGGGF